MIGESGIHGSVGIFGSVGISGGVGIGASAGGGGSPLPPIRPNSYLKYTFSQRDLTAAITDRVSNSDILTTTIGTDVNAVQTIDGGITTFNPLQQAFDVGTGALIEPSAVNLIPANLVDWLVTGGLTVGSPVFTNETGFGEVEFSVDSNLIREYVRANFSAPVGDVTISTDVLDGGSKAIRLLDVLIENGGGSVVDYKVNGVVFSSTTEIHFQAGDIIEATFNFTTAQESQARFGLGVATGTELEDGMSIKLTRPQVEAGTQRSSFIQPNGAPAPRDASTPTVPNGNLPNSETVVYDEYINLSTFDIPTLLWAYADTRTQAAIGVIDSGNGLGDTLQLIRVDGTGTTLTPLSVTMAQGISRNDRILTKAYLKSDLFTLVVENQTTGETQSASNASIAGTIGGLGPIALGDAGTVASTFSRKIVDFEITAYTTP